MLRRTPASHPAIPDLDAHPLLGNMREFRSRRLELLLRVARECGDIGLFRVGLVPVVLVNSAPYAYRLLVEQAEAFEKSPLLRRYLRPLIGNGLLSSENQFHRRQRKLIAPAFQPREIAGYGASMVDAAERIQHGWTTGSIIDVADEMLHLTLGIVGTTLFDADVLGEAEALGQLLTDLERIAEDMANAFVHLPASWPTRRNRQFRRVVARLDTTIYGMIEARQRSNDDRADVLGILLKARDEDDGSFMTDTQVRDEVVTLFLAGHATMATALAWTWCLLAQHPQAYARLQAEVDRVLAGRRPTVADLPDLPYTLQVFKEALRLYPPAFAILRRAVRPVEFGPYLVPRGMRVALSPYALHRRADSFANPEGFEPDHFMPAAEGSRARYAYLPFGAGPRVCIGNHFALMEGHLLLAALAQRVTFELVPGQWIAPETQSSLTPEHGIKVVVRRRE